MTALSKLFILAAAACTDTVVEVGVIEHDGPVNANVPSNANIGQSLLVGLATYGDGCVSFERTDVELSPDAARITPYDVRREGNCPQIQLEISHDVDLVFETAGPKTISITGRKKYFGGGQLIDEIVERSFPTMVDP